MPIFLMVIQIVVSIALILAVIFQRRKSSRASGIFGGGTIADYGGKKGREALLMKVTTVIAVIFIFTSLIINLVR
ncbi:MAG: hypothetical protein Kow00103_04300 [Candidatus Caldatribacteriota bacterium]